MYNSALALASPIIAGYFIQRHVTGKSSAGWDQRWGRLPEELKWKESSRKRVWIHAVSAGEVVAAVPILRELRALLPNQELLLSVTTPAGLEIAQQQAQPYVDSIFFSPFDLPWVTSGFVDHLRPQIFVTLESELWPNLLHHLKRGNVKTIMVNGRMTEGSFNRIQGPAKSLFQWMLSNMDILLVQSEADARRLRALGHFSDVNRVKVLGNSKFDQDINRLSGEETRALKLALKLPETAPVFIAGSTRSPEEESVVMESYKKMRERFPELTLILAPRQIDRAEEVEIAMRKTGLSPVRKTQISEAEFPVRHLILDTMGELANVYAVATFVFVGNSFAPVIKGGGQNLLQPLAHGKPILFGPLTATIRSEAALAIDEKVGFRVENGEQLTQIGLRLLRDSALREEIERRALSLIATNRGVSRKYAESIALLAEQS